MTTTIHAGKYCGSWEATVDRTRETIKRLPEFARTSAELTLEVHELRFAEAIEAQGSLTPQEVDERCRDLDCSIPEPLDEIAGMPLTLDGAVQQLVVVIGELLALRERVTELEGRLAVAR